MSELTLRVGTRIIEVGYPEIGTITDIDTEIGQIFIDWLMSWDEYVNKNNEPILRLSYNTKYFLEAIAAKKFLVLVSPSRIWKELNA